MLISSIFLIRSNFSNLLIDFDNLSSFKKTYNFFLYIIIQCMDENEKHLLTIRDEMENVRELYIKGYIDVKELINQKQERFLKWLQIWCMIKKY